VQRLYLFAIVDIQYLIELEPS